ncbi:helix-turn-helix transcriptional regulator [Fibrella forsythiae]|uniref:Helix-turn-helix domain-containing protein n=1 Tax=Fibrella forsythiae TaxID=2817061 RepID=A0ABS3JQV6_9BACT|nr:helix-turn-helix domain-containing protein [Fibrella forsythiae]MBO0951584.1 helix-turn-helix domain-containing protein [Fibrella forsythiae]
MKQTIVKEVQRTQKPLQKSRVTIALDQKPFLRPTEVLELFGISRAKFWAWANADYFPLVRPDGPQGRIVFVRRADIQQFIETGKPVIGAQAI